MQMRHSQEIGETLFFLITCVRLKHFLKLTIDQLAMDVECTVNSLGRLQCVSTIPANDFC